MTETKNVSSSRKHNRKIIALLLVAAMLVTGAFAFLTASDSKENVFTMGKVAIQLNEETHDAAYPNGQARSDWSEDGISYKDVLPGESRSKVPTIENTGNNPAFVYMMVGVPTDTVIPTDDQGNLLNNGELTLTEMFKMISNENTFDTSAYTEDAAADGATSHWKYLSKASSNTESDKHNYYIFYYDQVLPSGESTDPIFDHVKLISSTVPDFVEEERTWTVPSPEELADWTMPEGSYFVGHDHDSENSTTDMYFIKVDDDLTEAQWRSMVSVHNIDDGEGNLVPTEIPLGMNQIQEGETEIHTYPGHISDTNDIVYVDESFQYEAMGGITWHKGLYILGFKTVDTDPVSGEETVTWSFPSGIQSLKYRKNVTNTPTAQYEMPINAYAIQTNFYGQDATPKYAWNRYVAQNGEEAFSSLGFHSLVFENAENDVVHSEIVQTNQPLTMYFDDSLVRVGSSFNWVDPETNKIAYTGMKMPNRTLTLQADYTTNAAASQDPSKGIFYNILYDPDSGELYAEASNVVYDDPTYPTSGNATLVIPSSIDVTFGSYLTQVGEGPSFNPAYHAMEVSSNDGYVGSSLYELQNGNSVCADGFTNGYTGRTLDRQCAVASLDAVYNSNAAGISGSDRYTLPVNTTVTIPVKVVRGTLGAIKANGELVANHGANYDFSTIVFADSLTVAGINANGDSYGHEQSSIRNVVLPYGCKGLVNGAFWGQDGLTEITLPASMTEVRYDAFHSCSGLTTLNIPASIRSFDTIGSTFSGCTSLTTINYAGTEAQWNAISGLSEIPSGVTVNYNASF